MASSIRDRLTELRADRQRLIAMLVRVALVGVSTFIAIRVVEPSQIVRNTTPTGGDMGAHVWGPAYLRDHLLPWKLTGWSMDWYSGLPAYRFYMVIPALFIVFLDVVLPYAVAFKLIAVAGVVTLPFCCWLFGRLARFAYPIPELFALAGLVFLLDESYTIYGGNLASTMAGEFSFSISLSFALVAFGLFASGLETGRHRIKAAVFMALAVLSHGIVAIYVAVGLLVMLALWADRRRLRWFLVTVGTGSLLSAFWIVPFLLNHAYMTDMKYKGEPGNGSFTSYWGMFFALPPFWNIFFMTFALIGLGAMVARRHRTGLWLGFTGALFAVFVYVFNDSLPVIGLLWNPRLLPMLNLCRYLLAAIGIVEVVSAVVRLVQLERLVGASHRASSDPFVSDARIAREDIGEADDAGLVDESVSERMRRGQFNARSVAAVFTALVALLVLGFRFQSLPFGSRVNEGQGLEYSWGPFETRAGNRGFVDGWARWNFSGYESRSAYGEYYQVVQTMKEIGESRGCGRALWENFGGNDRYGTTMALMLLPFWTNGCIASSEGLFFEAAGTTPYHFLAAGAMSKQSSNPVRELRYVNNNASVGVPYLRALGVNYYMAVTPEAVAQADVVAASDGGLRQIAQAGPWRIYEVADSDLVVPLASLPVVVAQRGGDQRERWLELGTSWLQQPLEWPVLPAGDGPDDWPRAEVEIDLSRREGVPGSDSRKVDIVTLADSVESISVEPAVVSDVVQEDESVSFRVDRTGTPVLVRVSYFPNWKATGAQGPYRVAPNMMVVVPTSNEVTLSFEPSPIDRFAYVLTLTGFVAVFLLWRSNRRQKMQVSDHAGFDGDHESSQGDVASNGMSPPSAPQTPTLA
ncbi:MAG: 6-pyruvoyl-tetrahydropterin synthase-related protein [Ilumatobacteraceae bacterium]